MPIVPKRKTTTRKEAEKHNNNIFNVRKSGKKNDNLITIWLIMDWIRLTLKIIELY
jgi:hypothetical protein